MPKHYEKSTRKNYLYEIMNLSLSGRHAIVCGSTQGIGLACAEALATLGARVTMLARNPAALHTLSGKLPIPEKQQHDYIAADFSDPEAVRTAVHKYMSAGNTVHILVNNTGGPASGPAMNAKTSDFERAFAAHLVCNQILVQAVAAGMRAEEYGRIINIISTSVREPIRGLGVSNTIRAAVAGWAKTISTELAPYGITVNNVLPGATRTARLDALIEAKAKAQNVSRDDIKAQMIAEIPAGRFAAPHEIANAVAFLASPAASYISGVSLPVDGGRMRAI